MYKNEWDAQMLHLQCIWGEQYGRSSEALLGRAANTVCVVWANNRLFTWYSCTHVEVCIWKAQNVQGCFFPNQITAMATSSNQVEISISPQRRLCSVWLASSYMTLNERIDQAPCDLQYLGAYCVVRSHLDVCTGVAWHTEGTLYYFTMIFILHIRSLHTGLWKALSMFETLLWSDNAFKIT